MYSFLLYHFSSHFCEKFILISCVKRIFKHSARTSNLEPRTSNLEPRTSNLEPRTSNLEPRTSNLEPRTSNLEPRTSNLEPRTSNLEPRTSNLEPRTSNLEPRTSNLRYKKGHPKAAFSNQLNDYSSIPPTTKPSATDVVIVTTPGTKNGWLNTRLPIRVEPVSSISTAASSVG